MQLNLDTNIGANSISAYSEQGIQIAGRWYSENLIITPKKIITNWQAHIVTNLTLEDFKLLLPEQPEVLILGTGKKCLFPPKPLYVQLAAVGTGLEVMDTRAACRTFNILLSEDRAVATALCLE